MITDDIRQILHSAIQSAQSSGELPDGLDAEAMSIDPPKNSDFGDFATNLALIIQKQAGKPSREIANIISSHIPVGDALVDRVEIAGPGFINFHLSPLWLKKVMERIEFEDACYGTNTSRKGEKTLIEFVSANPTGPISVVNGRAAALGDTLARLLSACGADVEREFYVNDALNSTQINLMGESLEMRYKQLLGHEIDFPENTGDKPEGVYSGKPCHCGEYHQFPKEGYRGEYLVEIAQSLVDEMGESLEAMGEEERLTKFRELAATRMIDQQKKDLKAFGVEFNTWFFESSLYDSGEVRKTIQAMKDRGVAYEKDGALWLKTTELSKDEQDRVLVRSNDRETYVAADAAYHKNKFDRGFTRLIDIWGADHHGYVQRLKAGVAALGYDSEKCEIILTQMILLMRGGEVVRGSKRAGDVIPLVDLVNEIGIDAARFYCMLNSYETTATFDLELAKKQSSDNPVFYAQYAHARCCSIRTAAVTKGVTPVAAEKIDAKLLANEREVALLRKLAEYPKEVQLAAEHVAPHRLTGFVREIGQALHQFYEECPALKDDVPADVRDARLAVFNATRIVVRNLLALLGVSAPEKM
ncbi:MAG: arginine--tRNA ligase [Chthonomonadales bacterium]